jgi:hypothetical protein
MPSPTPSEPGTTSTVRAAESALRRLGYARIHSRPRSPATPLPQFYVQEAAAPRRKVPVFVADAGSVEAGSEFSERPAILVVPDEDSARAAWTRLRSGGIVRADPEVSILVLAERRAGAPEPYWHAGAIEPRALLTLATGIIVGLFRRAASSGEGGQVDFEEMLRLMRTRFHIDVESTLSVRSDEDALWIMYQLAMRHSYAPGDSASNLHLMVLKPTGPSARLPWYAA